MNPTWPGRLRSRIAVGGAVILIGSVAACSPVVRASVPPGGADLTLYVRNASDAEAQIAIEFGPEGGSGKGIGFGRTVGIWWSGPPSC
jgi:hypothetical protein